MKKQIKNIVLYVGIFCMALMLSQIYSNADHVEAAKKKTYTITTKTKPVDNKFVKSKNYNSKTKHYYVLKSYMEKLESQGGGTLVLKKGTYTISNAVCIPSNVTIKLAKGTVIKKTKDTGTKNLKASPYLFYLVAPSKESKKNASSGYKGTKNVSIISEGATIDMNKTGATAFFMAHNSNVKIEGITFKNISGDSYVLNINGCKNVTINNCGFIGTSKKGTAILLDIPAKAKKQTKTWVKQDDTTNENVTVTNCTFNKVGRAVASVRFVKGIYQKGIVIDSNKIVNMGDDTIRAINWDAPKITNNTFKNVGTGGKIVKGATTFKRGIYLGGVKNPTVTGNRFDQVPLAIMAIPYKNTDKELVKTSKSNTNKITAKQIKAMISNNTATNLALPFIRIYDNKANNHSKYYFKDGITTYTVTPSTLPYKNDYMVSKAYNENTKHYFMLRSYLNQIESNGGGTLILTKGTYYLPAEVLVGSNTTIVFEDGVVVKKTATTGTSELKATTGMFSFVSPRGYDACETYKGYTAAKNVTLIGPENGAAVIDVNDQYNTLALILCHTENVTVENLTFKNMNGGHFIELDASKNAVIRNNVFTGYNKKNAGSKEAINLDIPDKNTGGIVRRWTSYDKTANQDITITGNTFKNVESAVGSHYFTDGAWHTNVKITDNVIDSCDGYAIKVMQWDSPVITGNTISNLGDWRSEGNKGVNMIGVKNPTIKENVFKNMGCYIYIYVEKQSKGNNAAKKYPVVYNQISAQNKQDMIYNNTLINVRLGYVSYTNTLNATDTQKQKWNVNVTYQ